MNVRDEYYHGKHVARQQARRAVQHHNGQAHLAILSRAQNWGEMLQDWHETPAERDITTAFMLGYASAIWGWVLGGEHA